MKAVVTGGAGFIGSHLVQALLYAGHHVVSIDDYSAGTEDNLPDYSLRLYKMNVDILQLDMLPLMGAEVVFHNAASKKVSSGRNLRRDLEVNAAGTLHLLDLCLAAGVKRFVHASTGSVYGQPISVPQTEEHPRNPTTAYGVSKTAAESYVLQHDELMGMRVTVLRYFHVYGPRQNKEGGKGGVVGIFADRILHNLNPVLHGGGRQERAFTFVGDVVEANLLVSRMDEAAGEVYNCCSGDSLTVRELAKKMIRLEHPKQAHFTFNTAPARVGEVYKFDVSNKKLSDLLGEDFEWTTLDAGLAETMEWYRRNLNRS